MPEVLNPMSMTRFIPYMNDRYSVQSEYARRIGRRQQPRLQAAKTSK